MEGLASEKLARRLGSFGALNINYELEFEKEADGNPQ